MSSSIDGGSANGARGWLARNKIFFETAGWLIFAMLTAYLAYQANKILGTQTKLLETQATAQASPIIGFDFDRTRECYVMNDGAKAYKLSGTVDEFYEYKTKQGDFRLIRVNGNLARSDLLKNELADDDLRNHQPKEWILHFSLGDDTDQSLVRSDPKWRTGRELAHLFCIKINYENAIHQRVTEFYRVPFGDGRLATRIDAALDTADVANLTGKTGAAAAEELMARINALDPPGAPAHGK